MGNNISWEANKWTGSTFNWLDTSASGPVAGLVAKIDAWVTSVNSNPSNSTKQITKLKDNQNSGGTRNGFVYRLATNTSTYAYAGYFNSSTSNRVVYFADTWTDDASNDGFGSFSGNGFQDVSISFQTAPTNWDTSVISCTVDGQEFISILHSDGGGSTAYEDGFMIFKDVDGDWAVVHSDSSSPQVGVYCDDAASTGWQALTRATGLNTATVSTINGATGAATAMSSNVNSLMGSIVWQYTSDIPYPATQDTVSASYKYYAQPANPNIFFGGTTTWRYGYRLILNTADSSNRTFITTGGYYNWCILIDGTP